MTQSPHCHLMSSVGLFLFKAWWVGPLLLTGTEQLKQKEDGTVSSIINDVHVELIWELKFPGLCCISTYFIHLGELKHGEYNRFLPVLNGKQYINSTSFI